MSVSKDLVQPRVNEDDQRVEAEPTSDCYIERLGVDIPSFQIQSLGNAKLYEYLELSPRKRQVFLEELQKNFIAAQTIVMVTGAWGIGDSVMEARVASILHAKTGKNIICQVSSVLQGVVPETEGVTFVTGLSEILSSTVHGQNNDAIFFLQLSTQSIISSSMDRFSRVFPNLEPQQAKILAMNLFNNGYFATYNAGFNRLMDLELSIKPHVRLAEVQYALILHMLGVEVTTEDFETSSLIDVGQVESMIGKFEGEPLYDLFMVLDASEGEVSDRTHDGREVARSMKSYPLKDFPAYFDQLRAKGIHKLLLLMGKQHPDYCLAVIELARAAGLEVTVEAGDNLAELLPRSLLLSQRFLGPDTGLTHLAEQYIKAFEKFDVHRTFLSYFNDLNVGISVQLYGVTTGAILVSTAEGKGLEAQYLSTDNTRTDIVIPPSALSNFVVSDGQTLA